MTEQQYLDATNLAKLRIAQAAIRDCLFMDQDSIAAENSIKYDLASMIRDHEKRVTLSDKDEE